MSSLHHTKNIVDIWHISADIEETNLVICAILCKIVDQLDVDICASKMQVDHLREAEDANLGLQDAIVMMSHINEYLWGMTDF